MAGEKILTQKLDELGVVVTIPSEGMSFLIYREPGVLPGVYYTRIKHLRPRKEFFEILTEAIETAVKKKPAEVIEKIV